MFTESRNTGFYLGGFPVGGYLLSTDNSNHSTIANTTETTLSSTLMPGMTLAAGGDEVVIEAYVKTGNNANSKQIRLYFGSTVIADSSMVVLTNQRFFIRAKIKQVSGASQNAFSIAVGNGAGADWGQGLIGNAREIVAGENINSAILIKLTGQNGTANAGDITCMMMTVQLHPAS